jgi:hypothetical protein
MAKVKTALVAAAMAAAMTASQAMAADGPLPLVPGKPAGVQTAQHSSHMLLVLGAATLAVIGVVIAVTTTNNATCDTACTTTPATTS